MKRIIILTTIITTILFNLACSPSVVYGAMEGLTLWLPWESVQAIHDCESCSQLIDWDTVDFPG